MPTPTTLWKQKTAGGYFKKDFTDFIMLDKIYQTAYSDKDIDTYIIFTGDSHFTSVVLFLKNVCRKKVVVYGVKNAFSGQLMTAASKSRVIEPDELSPLCRAIVENGPRFGGLLQGRASLVYANR